MRLTFLLPLLVSTAACATAAPEAEPERRMPAGDCDAGGVQSEIGSTASAELGARLLQQTGARTLRWVPPRTAVTMDFRPDRLTVAYDDGYRIERISCG